jgi:hypothetical protein
MFSTNHIIRRITTGIVLAASLAGGVQPALAFDGRSPDTREAAEQVAERIPAFVAVEVDEDTGFILEKPRALVDLRSPDTREAAEQGKPDSGTLVVDLRSPDTREAAEQAPGSGVVAVDLRSPDTRDAAEQRQPVSIVEVAVPADSQPSLLSGDRFHWGDFGVGVGIAFGAMLLIGGLAAAVLATRQRRGERTGPATT